MAVKHFILQVSVNFRNHIAYLGDKKSSKNAYITGWLLFTQQLVSLKGKLACQNRNALFLLDQWSAQNNNDPIPKHVMPVVFTSQHHQLHASMWLQDELLHETSKLKVSCAFLLQEIDRNVFGADVRKLNILETLNIVLLWQDNTPHLHILIHVEKNLTLAPSVNKHQSKWRTQISRWNCKVLVAWHIFQCQPIDTNLQESKD